MITAIDRKPGAIRPTVRHLNQHRRKQRAEATAYQAEVTDKARTEANEAIEESRAKVREQVESARAELLPQAETLAGQLTAKLLGRKVA